MQSPNVETTPINEATFSPPGERLHAGQIHQNNPVRQWFPAVSSSVFDTGSSGAPATRKPAKPTAKLLPNGDALRSAVSRASAVVTDKLFESGNWQQAVIDQLLWLAPKTPTSQAEDLPAVEADSEADAPVEVASLPVRQTSSVETAADNAEVPAIPKKSHAEPLRPQR